MSDSTSEIQSPYHLLRQDQVDWYEQTYAQADERWVIAWGNDHNAAADLLGTVKTLLTELQATRQWIRDYFSDNPDARLPWFATQEEEEAYKTRVAERRAYHARIREAPQAPLRRPLP